MIYYFSGTGNSQWVAQEIAAGLGIRAVNLAAPQGYGRSRSQNRMSVSDTVTSAAAADIEPSAESPAGNAAGTPSADAPPSAPPAYSGWTGFVFPIYAWGVPEIVSRYIREHTFPADTFRFAVATCGSDAGKALDRLNRIFPLQSCYSVAMPDNYLPLFHADTALKEQEKVGAARQQLQQIIADLQQYQSVRSVHEGSFAALKTAWVNPLFNHFAKRTRSFKVSDNCLRCGKCGRECPARAIRFDDEGLPVWHKKTCEICLRCLHYCPVEAIEKGRGTKGKARYYFGKNLTPDFKKSANQQSNPHSQSD